MGACNGQEHLERLLVGASNAQDLLNACRHGDVGIARLLLEAGVEKDAKDEEGCSALLHACCAGHAEIAGLLLEAGANMTLPSQHLLTAERVASLWTSHLLLLNRTGTQSGPGRKRPREGCEG